MIVRKIKDEDWSEILNIQEAAYIDVAPESLEVLKDKVHYSQGSSFVCVSDNKTVGYLISHLWNSEIPPKLDMKLKFTGNFEHIFLHDVAVNPLYKGRGIGQALLKKLLDSVSLSGNKSIRLVAVQGADSFWDKHGFTAIKALPLSDGYGENAVLMEFSSLA